MFAFILICFYKDLTLRYGVPVIKFPRFNFKNGQFNIAVYPVVKSLFYPIFQVSGILVCEAGCILENVVSFLDDQG